MHRGICLGISALAILVASDVSAQRGTRASREDAASGANSSRRGGRGNNAGIVAGQSDSTRRPSAGSSSSATTTVTLPNIKYFNTAAVSLSYDDLISFDSLLKSVMTPEGYAQYLEHPQIVTIKAGNNSTGGYASRGACSIWGWLKGDQLITVDAYNMLPSTEKFSYAPAIITGKEKTATNTTSACGGTTEIADCDGSGANPGAGTTACTGSDIHYEYAANEYLVIWDNLVVGGTPSYNINYNNAHAVAYLKINLAKQGSGDISYSSGSAPAMLAAAKKYYSDFAPKAQEVLNKCGDLDDDELKTMEFYVKGSTVAGGVGAVGGIMSMVGGFSAASKLDKVEKGEYDRAYGTNATNSAEANQQMKELNTYLNDLDANLVKVQGYKASKGSISTSGSAGSFSGAIGVMEGLVSNFGVKGIIGKKDISNMKTAMGHIDGFTSDSVYTSQTANLDIIRNAVNTLEDHSIKGSAGNISSIDTIRTNLATIRTVIVQTVGAGGQQTVGNPIQFVDGTIITNTGSYDISRPEMISTVDKDWLETQLEAEKNRVQNELKSLDSGLALDALNKVHGAKTGATVAGIGGIISTVAGGATAAMGGIKWESFDKQIKAARDCLSAVKAMKDKFKNSLPES
ncbi:MAG: hypothetical protein LBL52_04240 [Rickettsiales bacterium]|nr:hypothetical protein [Rickettsiales bacterium]